MISKRQINRLTRFLVGLGATLCLLVGLLPGALVSAQAVDVGVDAPASVESGEYFTAQVSISGVTDFDAAVFTVVFDSDVLEIENPTVGGTSAMVR